MNRYRVQRQRNQDSQIEYLAGFNPMTGEPEWYSRIDYARSFANESVATIAACNANDHGYIYGDPIVIPIKDKA